MRTYVMIAGVEYAYGNPNSGTKWNYLSQRRMKELVAANTAQEDQDFIFFDTLTGEQKKTEVRWSGGKMTENTSTLTTYATVTSSDYTGRRYTATGDDTISMPHVYDYLREIGRSSTHAGTLYEVSIFGHSWMGGPILVNSNDTSTTVNTRDADDKDGRWFDFRPPNMSAAELQELRQAFHPQGICWLWGCSFPKSFFKLLHYLLKSKDYRATGLKPTDALTLTRVPEVCYSDGWPLTNAHPDKPSTLNTTLKELQEHFCTGIKNTYNQILADATQCPVHAAALGTYTVFESGKKLMEVEPKLHRYTQFYTSYMNQAAAGRGYVVYSPNYRCP